MNSFEGSARAKQRQNFQRRPESVRDYFDLHQQLWARLPYESIERVATELARGYFESSTLFLLGNGGSASLASHFACDLGKGTLVPGQNGKRFRVIALTDNVPLMTAWANDSCYDDIFAEQLRSLMSPGDRVFAISGSGNSGNVLRALVVAKDSGLSTIGLTGFQGGKMKALCDHCIVIPSDNMQVIEDLHLSVAHALFVATRHQIATLTATESVVRSR